MKQHVTNLADTTFDHTAMRIGSDNPVIIVTGRGRGAYLWIGNDGSHDKRMLGTVHGAKTLEKLAKEILKAIKPKRRVRK